MADIKFGIPQISNPTPSRLNLWVRVFTVVAGIFMGWMVTTNLIDPHTQNAISSILGLLLAIVNGLAPLFGIEPTAKYVKAEDVTAMNETPKP